MISTPVLNPSSTNLDPATAPPPASEYSEGPIWMQRLFMGIYVLFCVTLGLTVFLLPWSEWWFQYGVFMRWPGLQHVLHLGFVRGAVSGLGLIDMWVGVHEAIHYREHRRGSAATPGFGTVPHDQQQ